MALVSLVKWVYLQEFEMVLLILKDDKSFFFICVRNIYADLQRDSYFPKKVKIWTLSAHLY